MQTTVGADRPARLGALWISVAVFATALLCTWLQPSHAWAAPCLRAMIEHNWIDGSGLPADTPVSLSVNTGAKGDYEVMTDSEGRFQGTQLDQPWQLAAGDVIDATWSGGSTQMVVRDVQVTADPASDRVSGTARMLGGGAGSLAGRRVNMIVQDYWGGPIVDSDDAVVQADGTFTLELSGAGFERGQKLFLEVFEDPAGGYEGHRTIREPYNGIPALGAHADHNWVDGSGFPFDTDVTITVNGGDKGESRTRSSSGGYLNINWWEVGGEDGRIAIGDVITASWSDESTQMVVQNVRTSVDVASDKVTGTAFSPGSSPVALVGRKVLVQVQDEDWSWPPLAEMETVVQASGSFGVDLTPLLDLAPGQNVQVTLYHAPAGSTLGHRTVRQAYNGIPALGAHVEHDRVDGYGFPFDVDVTIAVNGGDKGETVVRSDTAGNFNRDWWEVGGEDGRIAVGDTIEASWSGGSTETVVQDVRVTADAAADHVGGTAFSPDDPPAALAGSAVLVQVQDEEWNWPPLAEKETVVQADGSFGVDLAGELDVVPGQNVQVTVYHAADGSTSGHRTLRQAYNGLPSLRVNLDDSSIFLHGAPPDMDVTMSVNGGADYPDSRGRTDAGGNLHVEYWEFGDDFRVAVGDRVTASWAGDSTETVVQDVRGRLDLGSQIITGTARTPSGSPLTGRKVQVTVYQGDEDDPQVEGFVGADGTFVLDLSGVGVSRGDGVDLAVWHASDGSERGHRTSRILYNSIPTLGSMVEHNWTEGQGFPPDTRVAITLNGGTKASADATSDPGGNFNVNWWDEGDVRLEVGDTVRASFAGTTTTMVVQDVRATADPANDRVAGTAKVPGGAAGSLAGRRVQVGVAENWEDDWIGEAETTVQANGTFSVDLSAVGLERGHKLFLTLWDDPGGRQGGHRTMREPYNGIPALTVFVAGRDIEGESFPPETTVTLAVNGGAKGARQTNTGADGYFRFGDWGEENEPAHLMAPGDVVTASYDSTVTRMVIADCTGAVDTGADSVAGTIFCPPGTPYPGKHVVVGIEGGGEDGWVETRTVTRGDGTFAVDLGGYVDVERGQPVQVQVWDGPGGREPGNMTRMHFYNGIASLGVNLDNGNVSGEDLPFETTVTVAVQSKGSTETRTWADTGSFFVEDWSRGDLAKEPAVGDTMTASWDGESVQMVVQDLVATPDPATDRVVGTAFSPGHAPLAGHLVRVEVNPWWEGSHVAETTVAADGSFSVVLAPAIDLGRGDWVRVTLYDAPDGSDSGHRTIRTPYNGLPQLGVFVDHGWVDGGDFPPKTDATITAVGPGGSKGSTGVDTGRDGGFMTDHWEGAIGAGRLGPGDTVTATWDTTSTSMVVQDVTATADPDSDTVFGAARSPAGTPLAGHLVLIAVADHWGLLNPDEQGFGEAETTVGPDGRFSVRLFDGYDLKPGQVVCVEVANRPGDEAYREHRTKCQAYLLPPRVRSLSASAGDAKVALTWLNPATDWAATRILRSASGFATDPAAAGQVQVYDGTGSATTDTAVTNGTLYYYTAFARRSNGQWSRPTTTTARPVDVTPPGPVTGFTATSSDARVVLAWTDPATDFFATRIIRGVGSANFAATATDTAVRTIVYEGAAGTFTDTAVTNGTTYSYAAFVRDAAGNWSARATASAVPVAPPPPPPADTTPPGPVTGLTAVAGNTTATLTWVNPASDFAATRILRSETGHASSAVPAVGQLQVYEGAGTSFADTGLVNGRTYYYTAFARDAAGNWSTRTTVSAVPVAPLVKAKAVMGRPAVPRRILRNRYFYISGTVRGAHAVSTRVTLYLFRKKGRKWVRYKAVSVKVARKATSYRLRCRLPYKGDWYVYAGHSCAGHLASKSAKRSFKVR